MTTSPQAPLHPTDPFAELPPPPTDDQKPRRKHRLLITLATIGGLAVLGLVLLAVIGLGADQVLTHDLVDANFERNSAPFQTGDTTDFRFAQSAGAYRITAQSQYEASASAPAFTWAWFPRTAHAVDLATTIRALDHPGDVVGIGCSGPGSSTTDNENPPEFFGFVVGGGEAALIHSDPSASTDAEREDNLLAHTRDAPELTAGSTLTLTCADDRTGKGLHLVGSIDGEEILRTNHTHAGDTGFPAMVLAFIPTSAGHSVAFGNAAAHVPGE